MKKTLLAITAVMLIVFITGSAFTVLHTHPTYEAPRISHSDSSVVNDESIENGGVFQEGKETDVSHDQNCNIDNAEEGENLESAASNEPSERQVETSQGNDGYTDSCPPDGRVYWGSEPPYAYTPTCSSKRWPKLPIAPPELEG